jgi:mitochondrial cardiolipin hydrolase
VTTDLDALLDRALSDRALSRQERRELAAPLVDDPQKKRVLRERAFAHVARRLGPDAKAYLEWLEDVVELTTESASSTTTEVHESPSESSWQRIAELCEGARRAIDVCVFTITDDRISGELFRAHRRGVAVRIVSDDEKSTEPGSDIRRLKEAGVPVRLDVSIHHMHHKFALFDERTLLTGSYNWTRAAAESNQDNFLVSSDAQLVRGYQAIFLRMWGAAR